MSPLDETILELGFARKHFPAFNSPHEGYAILLEEVEELWTIVKANKGGTRVDEEHRRQMRREAVQVAAMALRFIEDVVP